MTNGNTTSELDVAREQAKTLMTEVAQFFNESGQTLGEEIVRGLQHRVGALDFILVSTPNDLAQITQSTNHLRESLAKARAVLAPNPPLKKEQVFTNQGPERPIKKKKTLSEQWRGFWYTPEGKPRFIWAERLNGPIYGLLIALGVPLLGWSGLGMGAKTFIAMLWFGLFPLYMLLEGRELTGQMEGRGSIDAPQARAQVRSGQLPYIGGLIAIFLWLLAWAAGWPSIAYGPIEWIIITHTWFAILLSNRIFYGLMMELLKSAPRGERVERRLP